MNRIRSITLPNFSALLPTAVLVIDYRDGSNELEITSIELHAEPGSQQSLADFAIEELPRDTQEAIYNALTLRLDRQRRASGLTRLLGDLRSQAGLS